MYLHKTILWTTYEPPAVRTDRQAIDLHLMTFELGNRFFGPKIP